MKYLKVLFFTIYCLLSSEQFGYATWISGTVLSVNSEENSVTFLRDDSKTAQNINKELDIKILQNTEYKNISSLNDINVGQHLRIDVRPDTQRGIWDTQHIELLTAEPESVK